MQTRAIVPLRLLLAGALLIPACKTREQAPPSGGEASVKEPMITLPVAENLTYLGLEEGVAVTLNHGRWEGDTIVPGSSSKPTVTLVRSYVLIGDVDGDDSEDGLVFLEGRSGGSAANMYWALIQHRGDGIENTALRRVGDRVQIRDARFEHDQIVLDVVQAGPEDDLAFPGELATRIWDWTAGAWRERANPNPTDRLMLATIEGTRWRLRAWAYDEPAPETPEVTLSVAKGRVSGRAGCNTYSAALRATQAPGEIAIASPVATRMACADSVMRREARFLSLLPKVDRFGFAATELALEYQVGSKKGSLYFERIPSEGGNGELPP